MNIQELKAKAYDVLAQIQMWQNELAKINEAIAIETQKAKEEVKEDVK